MTTAEIYRQKELSVVVQVAKYIFNVSLKNIPKVPLGELLLEIKTGKTPSKNDKRFYEDSFIDWFKPNEIGAEKYIGIAKEKLSRFAYYNGQTTVYNPRTILINAIGDIGRITILNHEASSNQQITGIRLNEKKLNIEYCYYYLLSNRHLFLKDLFQTTLPIINQKKISLIPIILPEIKIQEEIVDFLTKLENIKDKSELDRISVNQSYLDIARQFFSLKRNNSIISTELTHQLDLIKQLRQAFLREAMQGKLTPKWRESNPDVEPARELLKKIKAEKDKMVKEDKLKKQKPLPPIKEDEIPLRIPESWEWCRLGEPIYYTENLDIQKKFSATTLINYVDIDAIDNQNYIIRETKLKKVEELSTRARRVLKQGFIVYSTVRPYLKNIAVVEEELPNMIGSTGFNVFKPIKLHTKYLFYFLLNPDLNKEYEEMMIGFNSPSITNNQFENTLFPLPPLHEQQQIVIKLDELMQYCDDLEKSIKTSLNQNEMLLKQVLREALEGER